MKSATDHIPTTHKPVPATYWLRHLTYWSHTDCLYWSHNWPPLPTRYPPPTWSTCLQYSYRFMALQWIIFFSTEVNPALGILIAWVNAIQGWFRILIVKFYLVAGGFSNTSSLPITSQFTTILKSDHQHLEDVVWSKVGSCSSSHKIL